MRIQCREQLYTMSSVTWEQFAYFKLLNVDNRGDTDNFVYHAPDDFETILKFMTHQISCHKKQSDGYIIDVLYTCRKYALFLGLYPDSDIAGRLCSFISAGIQKLSTSKMVVQMIESACGELSPQDVFCFKWSNHIKQLLAAALLPFQGEACDCRNTEILRRIYESTQFDCDRDVEINRILHAMYDPQPKQKLIWPFVDES